jgi:NitT/TauT family transport system substrate-binding protein
MPKLRIQPHGRLQEWVAHEKGYFRELGLDYEFGFVPPPAPAEPKSEIKIGAFELFREGLGSKGGVECDISSACHWAVNQASAVQIGRMWGHAYSIVPSGIYVPPESSIRRPEDMASAEIAVGYHSGSHFTAIQGLEAFLPTEAIRLRFVGRPLARLEAALAREVPAVSAWGTSGYVLEQHDFRRILDTTFMVRFLFPKDVDESDIEKFLEGLKRAQMDIDLTPEKYKHYYQRELPDRILGSIDVRRFGVGERIVFLPYTKEMYEATRRWMEERKLFDDDSQVVSYELAVRI